MQHPRKQEWGFTLVELAIVLMIIGLLIGGILRGQELMANAQVTATAQQVTSYSGAIATFEDGYGSKPGDMANALARLPGCTAANGCVNGDGNGILGVLAPGQGAVANQPWSSVTNAVNSENTQFWKHLAMAKLISGVNPSAQTPDWSQTHPTSKMVGGFFARQTNFAMAGFPVWTGTILVMRNDISGNWACGGGAATNEACTISAQRAAQMDRKLDDGLAMSGDTRAVSANWTNGCGNPNQGLNGASGYAENREDRRCDIMFRIY